MQDTRGREMKGEAKHCWNKLLRALLRIVPEGEVKPRAARPTKHKCRRVEMKWERCGYNLPPRFEIKSICFAGRWYKAIPLFVRAIFAFIR